MILTVVHLLSNLPFLHARLHLYWIPKQSLPPLTEIFKAVQ